MTVLGIRWCPVPRQQLVQPVDLVIVDAVEDIGKVGLRIKAVQLGGFDDGQYPSGVTAMPTRWSG
ncbi:MAG: hypothetical protein ACI82J_001188 [Sulfitobacter litoralis]